MQYSTVQTRLKTEARNTYTRICKIYVKKIDKFLDPVNGFGCFSSSNIIIDNMKRMVTLVGQITIFLKNKLKWLRVYHFIVN